MHLTDQDIKDTDQIKRLNLINSITGIKPANMIGTVSQEQKTNLAIVSSVTHIGSDPALLGFISRTFGASRRHTYENILEMKVFTINQVHSAIATKAHYTSAKFEKG
ncbi:MAG: flavin reductase, partial [Bacteroidales bacterium]|nr:flavin reductase [Bacteroidales bacterium]